MDTSPNFTGLIRRTAAEIRAGEFGVSYKDTSQLWELMELRTHLGFSRGEFLCLSFLGTDTGGLDFRWSVEISSDAHPPVMGDAPAALGGTLHAAFLAGQHGHHTALPLVIFGWATDHAVGTGAGF